MSVMPGTHWRWFDLRWFADVAPARRGDPGPGTVLMRIERALLASNARHRERIP